MRGMESNKRRTINVFLESQLQRREFKFFNIKIEPYQRSFLKFLQL